MVNPRLNKPFSHTFGAFFGSSSFPSPSFVNLTSSLGDLFLLLNRKVIFQLTAAGIPATEYGADEACTKETERDRESATDGKQQNSTKTRLI